MQKYVINGTAYTAVELQRLPDADYPAAISSVEIVGHNGERVALYENKLLSASLGSQYLFFLNFLEQNFRLGISHESISTHIAVCQNLLLSSLPEGEKIKELAAVVNRLDNNFKISGDRLTVGLQIAACIFVTDDDDTTAPDVVQIAARCDFWQQQHPALAFFLQVAVEKITAKQYGGSLASTRLFLEVMAIQAMTLNR